ncbi:MAG: winged helix DNA-binding domain-containing protein, partial [candidate division NC10 bacterium]|nr:winged helix DNA-binding domain-containing protein [candidate division NC10 bacterium]
LATPDLRKAVMMRDPDRGAEFDRAMAELQRGLWIVKVEEVYDPDFYYRWDLLDNWLPGPVEASLDLPRDEAVRQLVAAYLRNAAASQPRFLAGLFGLGGGEVETALRWLEAKGQIRRDQRVKGLPGSWVIWKGLGSATTDERR